MSRPRLFDPGLQPERTELAWRRTALAIGVVSLLALRVLPAITPDAEAAALMLVPGGVGLAFAATLWALAGVRHRRVTRALLDGRTDALPGAGLLMTLTVFVVACAVVAALLVLLPFRG